VTSLHNTLKFQRIAVPTRVYIVSKEPHLATWKMHEVMQQIS